MDEKYRQMEEEYLCLENKGREEEFIKKYLKKGGKKMSEGKIIKVKATEVKEKVSEIIEDKGWHRMFFLQHKRGYNPETEGATISYLSSRYNFMMNGFEIFWNEAQDFSLKKEPEYIIKVEEDVIDIQYKSEAHLEIFNWYDYIKKQSKPYK